MKTIGIIGGLTWLSTVEYYKIINQLVNEKLGGVSSAKIWMYSVNFEEIKKPTMEDDWDTIASIIGEAAQKLQAAGADCLLLGANTMHHIADKVQSRIDIPLLHIARAVAKEINAAGLHKVALLGTKYTMQLPFYKAILQEQNIDVLLPDADDMEYINNAIYSEMGKGLFLPATKEKFLQIIEGLKQQGAEGIIMGCTEIPILLKDADCDIVLLDTMEIHAKAAVEFVLG